jgi:hypothetical protein
MKTLDDLLAALRVEIGLAPDDTTQDAWLSARAGAVLAAMRNYTRRWLWPASQFRDAFQNMAARGYPPMPPPNYYSYSQADVVVLAEIPVQEILSVMDGATPQDASEYEWLTTGRLFKNDGTNIAPVVVQSQQLLVDYVAGYQDLPADLYEVIAGTVKKAWAATDAGAASEALGGGNISKLTVFDVGSVELASPGGFYEADVKDAGAGGPILGPWAAQLDYYRDYGRGIGLPARRDSTYVGDAPAARTTA